MIYKFTAEKTDANLNFDITLEKDKQVYCFISENGVGKTNLLENMAKTLIVYHSMFRDKQDNFRYSGTFGRKTIHDKIKDCGLHLALDISINDEKVKDPKTDDWEYADFNKFFSPQGPGFEYFVVSTGRESNFIFDKPLVFIGAKDRGYTQNIDRNSIKILGSKDERFVEAFLRSLSYMTGGKVEDTEIADWFNSRLVINPDFVPRNENRSFEVFHLLELMQKLEPNLEDLIARKDDTSKVNFYFSEGKLYLNNIPIDKLSTGFVALIKIFQEIIAGFGGWIGLHDETNLGDVEGVVFIDELESHLHPKWQSNFIPLLKEFFPKTTFYIATHSPLVVSTTDEGEAYELVREGNDVTAKKLGNPKDWYLVDVFSQGFHVDFAKLHQENGNETPGLAERLQNFSTMVKDYTSTGDEKLKEDIEELYQAILPSLAEDDPRRRSLDSLKRLVA